MTSAGRGHRILRRSHVNILFKTMQNEIENINDNNYHYNVTR